MEDDILYKRISDSLNEKKDTTGLIGLTFKSLADLQKGIYEIGWACKFDILMKSPISTTWKGIVFNEKIQSLQLEIIVNQCDGVEIINCQPTRAIKQSPAPVPVPVPVSFRPDPRPFKL